MRNSSFNPLYPILFFIAAGFALFIVMAGMVYEINTKFIVVIPMVCLVLGLTLIDIKWVFVLVFFTRSLLDPLLNLTKVSVGSGTIGVGAVINALMIALCLFFILMNDKWVTKNIRLAAAWLVFLLLCAAAVFYAPKPVNAVRQFINMSSYFLLFLTAIIMTKKETDGKFWIKVLLASSIPTVLVCNAAYIFHYDPFFLDWLGDTGRFNGTFTHANIFAFYLVLMIALCVYVFKSRMFRLSFPQRCALTLYLLNLFVLLLATRTRSAWFACLLLFFMFGLLRDKRILILSVLLPLLLLALPSVNSRVSEIFMRKSSAKAAQLNSFEWRVKLWKSSFEEIKRRPLFGYGLTSFEYHSRIFFGFKEDKRIMERGYAAHNAFLEILFEIGLVGLFAYASIFIGILKALFLDLRRRASAHKNETALVFCYLAGFLACSASDNMLYYLAFNWYFWFFLGVSVKILAIRRNPPAVG